MQPQATGRVDVGANKRSRPSLETLVRRALRSLVHDSEREEAPRKAPAARGEKEDETMKRASLEQAEASTRAIGHRIKELMPPGWGFILWLESFGEDGFATYISSIERETAMRSLREWLARMETSPRTSEFVDDTAASCWCCGDKNAELVTLRGPHRSVDLCRVCLATK